MRATPATSTPPPADITTADQSEGDSTTAMYRAAIGPVSAGYYLPLFTRFEAADRAGLSWNWSAALCTLSWMAYRQLWSAALAYAGAVVGLALLVFGIGRLVFQIPESTQWGLLLVFSLAAIAGPGLYGNALFHAQCRKRMAHALLVNNTLPEACALLKRQASSRQRLAWLTLANAAVAGMVLMGYFSAPPSRPLAESPPKAIEVHNQALDQALDAALKPLAPASAPVLALAPAATASAPSTTASAPSTTASAPALVASEPVYRTEPKKEVAEIKPPQAAEAPTAVAVAQTADVPKAVAVVQAKKALPQAAAKPAPKVVAVTPPAKVPAKAEKAAKAPITAKASASTATPAAAEPHFLINAGLFADDNNARNVYVKLSDAGFAVFKQEIQTKKGLRTRVRVGPFDSEDAAQTAAEKIRALGLDALVFKP